MYLLARAPGKIYPFPSSTSREVTWRARGAIIVPLMRAIIITTNHMSHFASREVNETAAAAAVVRSFTERVCIFMKFRTLDDDYARLN